jgi:low affinity Fe/Cu permease
MRANSRQIRAVWRIFHSLLGTPQSHAKTPGNHAKETMKLKEIIEDRFARMAAKAATASGSFWAFSLALFSIVAWGITGPIFHFSESWQLVVNTGTTIITFLMVFLIQHAQNNDMRAVQLKLNELIASIDKASNRLIDVEDLSEHEVERLYARYRRLVKTSARVEEAPGAALEKNTPANNQPQAKPRAVHRHS